MLSLYWNVARTAGKRAVTSWPVALSLIVYAVILGVGGMVAQGLGPFVGGIVLSLVFAACWSSYLELISQAVLSARFRISFDEFKRTFFARFWDVISVMFAFFVLSLLTTPLTMGERGPAVAAMIGFAIGFFFNVIPELLYQGSSRSFALLIDSARFVMQYPVAWFAPNLLFAAAALAVSGGLFVNHPTELLLAFGNLFSSPLGVAGSFEALPLWAKPLWLVALHFVMIFRGLLFRELSTGGANPRMRAFRAKLR